MRKSPLASVTDVFSLRDTFTVRGKATERHSRYYERWTTLSLTSTYLSTHIQSRLAKIINTHLKRAWARVGVICNELFDRNMSST